MQGDFYSSISGAIGCFKGLIHGGASAPVSDYLQRINSKEDAEKLVIEYIDTKQTLFGFGHLFLKYNDVRANTLYKVLNDLCKSEHGDILMIKSYDWMVEAVHKYRPDLIANPELGVGVLDNILGLYGNFAPIITTLSRLGGWCAHIIEKRRQPYLFYGTSIYEGDHDKKYIPI